MYQMSRLADTSPAEMTPPATAESGGGGDSGLTARPGPGGWPDISYLFTLADTALVTAMAEGAQQGSFASGGMQSPSAQSPFGSRVSV